WMARSLRRTLESIAMPSCVKAWGAWRAIIGDLFEADFAVTNRDRKSANSRGLSWNMKSSGNRSLLRLTACINAFGSTSYRAASSVLNRTRLPRMSRMRRVIGSRATAWLTGNLSKVPTPAEDDAGAERESGIGAEQLLISGKKREAPMVADCPLD